MQTKKYMSKIFLCLSLCLVTACAASGPEFTPVTATNNTAVIHVYRVRSYIWAGAEWYLRANGKRFTALSNGGFYTYVSKPGNVTLSSTVRPKFGNWIDELLFSEQELITISARAGKTHYVKFEVNKGPVISMHLVSRTKGEAEIKSLNRIAP